MAVVLGTSSGFVTVAPSADPAGTDVVIDGASVVTKDTSPATAFKITEIGWYRGIGTDTANFEVALYAESAGIAATRLFVDATNSSSTQGWIRTAVNWLISGNTAYWLAVQMDAHSGSSDIDSAASGGVGIDRLTSQSTLASPYGGGAVADADGMYAIYALWVPVPSGAATQALTATFTTQSLTLTSTARLSLAAGNVPTTRTLHTIGTRARVSSGTGQIAVALYEGSTNVSGWLLQTLTGSLADYSIAISDAAAASITSYADLEIRIQGQGTHGAATFEVDQVYLNTPAGTPTSYGATTQTFTLGSTTAGSHSAAGVTTQTLTGTFTTVGTHSSAGVVSDALTATFTTQGNVTKTGAATQNLTATFTTTGTHPSAGAVVDALAGTFTTAGITTRFGSVVDALTSTFTTAGVTTRYGVTHGGQTNLLSNGGFETNTTGWTTVGSTLTLDSVGPQHLGAQHGNIDTANAAINEGAYATFTATAAAYTVSIWLNDEHGTHNMRLAVRDNAGANAQTSTPFTPPAGSWSRYTFTTTALTAGTWRFYVETVGKQHADLDMDGAQAQLGSVATPYVETNGAPATKFGVLEEVVQGITTRFAAIVDALTATFTTQGITTRYGAVSDALTATFTTQGAVTAGAVEYFGAATQDFASTFTTNGVREAFGQVVLADAFGGPWGQSGLVADFTTQGRDQWVHGAATQDLAATFTTQGDRVGTSGGATTQALSATFTTVGTHPSAGVVADALTATFTTQGIRTVSGATSQSFTATFTTAGTHPSAGASTQALTATFTTVGTHPSAGVVSDAFAATFTTAGAQQGQQFGASSAVLTATFTTAGKLDTHAAVVAPFTATFTTLGFKTTAGAVVFPLAGTFTTQGTAAAAKFGSVVAAFTYTSTTSAQQPEHFGQSAVTLALAVATVGQVGAQGVVILPLTGAYTSAGYASALARAAAVDFLLGITTYGTKQGSTLIMLPPVWAGHIAYGRTGEAAEEARARGRIATNGNAHIEEAEEGLVAV